MSDKCKHGVEMETVCRDCDDDERHYAESELAAPQGSAKVWTIQDDEIACEVAKDMHGIIGWKCGERVFAQRSNYVPGTYTIRPQNQMGPTMVGVPGDHLRLPTSDWPNK